jgi:hypothetical protein
MDDRQWGELQRRNRIVIDLNDMAWCLRVLRYYFAWLDGKEITTHKLHELEHEWAIDGWLNQAIKKETYKQSEQHGWTAMST